MGSVICRLEVYYPLSEVSGKKASQRADSESRCRCKQTFLFYFRTLAE